MLARGGRSPAAYRRAARFDGWIGAQHQLEEIPGIVAALKAERAALGKDGAPFEIQLNLYDYSADMLKRVAEMGDPRKIAGDRIARATSY